MATIRSLTVALRANTGPFKKKMRTAGKVVKDFSATIARSAMRLAKWGAAIGAAAIAIGAVFIKKAMNAIDVVAKLSDRTGAATEDLMRLSHAAKITGMSQEDMFKSIEMFTRRLGEARQGTGEAIRALEGLGLSADALATMPLPDAIAIISDRMRRSATQADKAAVAYQLFGRSGQKMLNLLQLGRDEFKSLTADADRLGLTFSRFDAAQVEKANDALTEMRAVITGIWQKIAIELAPVVKAMSKTFTEWATKGEGIGVAIAKAIRGALVALLEMMAKVEQMLRKLGDLQDVNEGNSLLGDAPTKAMLRMDQADQMKRGWGKKAGNWLTGGLLFKGKGEENFETARQLGVAIDDLGKQAATSEPKVIGLFDAIIDELDKVKKSGVLGVATITAPQQILPEMKVQDFGAETLRVAQEVGATAEKWRTAVEGTAPPIEKFKQAREEIEKARFLLGDEAADKAIEIAMKQAMDQAKMLQRKDPGSFLELGDRMSVAGLQVGDPVQNKQLAQLEAIAVNTGIAAANDGMPY